MLRGGLSRASFERVRSVVFGSCVRACDDAGCGEYGADACDDASCCGEYGADACDDGAYGDCAATCTSPCVAAGICGGASALCGCARCDVSMKPLCAACGGCCALYAAVPPT